MPPGVMPPRRTLPRQAVLRQQKQALAGISRGWGLRITSYLYENTDETVSSAECCL